MIIPRTKKVFCLGLDLGKAAENTAIAVVEKVAPAGWNALVDCPPDKAEFHVRHLDRLPPGTYYTDVTKKVGAVLSCPALSDTKEITTYKTVREIDLFVDLVIDQTAVGEKVTDMIVGLIGKQARRAVLSGTQGESYSGGLYHVPKLSLIGGLDVLMETKRFKIPEDGQHSRQLIDELLNFRGRKTSLAALTADTWRDQPSDDLVFAVALACWRLQQPGFSYEFVDLW